jgi:hypothetical protein
MAMAVFVAPLVEEPFSAAISIPFRQILGVLPGILVTGSLWLDARAQLGWTWGSLALLTLVGVISPSRARSALSSQVSFFISATTP